MGRTKPSAGVRPSDVIPTLRRLAVWWGVCLCTHMYMGMPIHMRLEVSTMAAWYLLFLNVLVQKFVKDHAGQIKQYKTSLYAQT